MRTGQQLTSLPTHLAARIQSVDTSHLSECAAAYYNLQNTRTTLVVHSRSIGTVLRKGPTRPRPVACAPSVGYWYRTAPSPCEDTDIATDTPTLEPSFRRPGRVPRLLDGSQRRPPWARIFFRGNDGWRLWGVASPGSVRSCARAAAQRPPHHGAFGTCAVARLRRIACHIR